MPRRRLVRRLVSVAALVAAAGAVGGVAWARSGGGPGFRTAAVTRGSVTSTLGLVGTLTPLRSATVGFAQSGTVASVDVSVGQAVTAGQPLAQLDLTALRARLTQAQATEAEARQTLAQAQSGQLPSGGNGAGSPSGRSGTPVDTAAVRAAQKTVEGAQTAADQAQAAARSALSAASAACGTGTAPASGAAASGPAAASGAAAGGKGRSPGSPAAAGTPAAASGGSACLSAESALLQAEQDLARRQDDLATAQTALGRQLTQAGAGSANSSATTGIRAVQLAQYQAALDADTAAVAVAQQNLDQGTAVSPLTGTVVSVGFSAGDPVSAASAGQVVVVSAPNGYEVAATVPTADIASVSVGEHASVLPDGGSRALPATVTSVGATAGSSGFPVVLGLSGSGAGLRQGATAAVTLTTGAVSDATVVPTSAVHRIGSRAVVQVLNGSTPQPAVVTLGVVGPLRTQVLSGLGAGQRVVLADLSSTVTSDSSTTGPGLGRLGAGAFAGVGRFRAGAGAGRAAAGPGG